MCMSVCSGAQDRTKRPLLQQDGQMGAQNHYSPVREFLSQPFVTTRAQRTSTEHPMLGDANVMHGCGRWAKPFDRRQHSKTPSEPQESHSSHDPRADPAFDACIRERVTELRSTQKT